jgi:hypothetical protein
MRLLVGAMLGLAAGVLTGVIAAVAYPAADFHPRSGSRRSGV